MVLASGSRAHATTYKAESIGVKSAPSSYCQVKAQFIDETFSVDDIRVKGIARHETLWDGCSRRIQFAPWHGAPCPDSARFVVTVPRAAAVRDEDGQVRFSYFDDVPASAAPESRGPEARQKAGPIRTGMLPCTISGASKTGQMG